MADAVVVELARMTVWELEQMAADKSLERANERDHLHPAAIRAADELVRRDPRVSDVKAQHALSFVEWPRLGSADLALTLSDDTTAVIELKCGSGRDALGPCVWDVTKLAFAVQRDVISAAYLLAGAPTADWETPIRGCEFFGTATWEAHELRAAYEDWWRSWEKRGDPQPTQVPHSVATVELGSYPVAIGGTPWELRLARVHAGTEWLPWEPLVPPAL